jgi:hypothetical protein
MSGDVPVRFCERLGVRPPRATHPICHCRSEAQALKLCRALEQRFAECRLQLHPQKTKVVYCNDANRPGKYPGTLLRFPRLYI